MRRLLATTAALFVLLAAASARQITAADRFRALLAEDEEFRHRAHPEGATLDGDHRFDARWTEYTARTRAADVAHARDVLDRLANIDPTKLSEQDALSHELLRREYALELETSRFPAHLLIVDQLRGLHLRVPRVFAAMSRATAADYETIIARFDALPHLLEQWQDLLREGLSKGITPPQAAIGELPSQVLGQVAGADPFTAPLLAPFASMPEPLPAETRERLRQRASAVFVEKVRPAYERFAAFLRDTYVPGARRTSGFGDLPDGAAWYALELRRHTTTTMTPRELHDAAMREIDRVTAGMLAVKVASGFKGTLAEFRESMNGPDEAFSSTRDVVREVRNLAKRAEALLPRYFSLLPRTPLGVDVAPAFLGVTTAYYEAADPGGTRAGMFYVPSDPAASPRWRLPVLALHEGVPGHHLQRALASELSGLPAFRRRNNLTAYVEGWATYAADMIGEDMGFYRDPPAEYGRLADRMFGVSGVAADTGLHAFGWTREQVMDLRRNATGARPQSAAYAANRLSVWPGQIAAYTVGGDVIAALRREIAAAQGEKFDVREFHRVVLRDGPLPLDLLQQRVRTYYARR